MPRRERLAKGRGGCAGGVRDPAGPRPAVRRPGPVPGLAFPRGRRSPAWAAPRPAFAGQLPPSAQRCLRRARTSGAPHAPPPALCPPLPAVARRPAPLRAALCSAPTFFFFFFKSPLPSAPQLPVTSYLLCPSLQICPF